MSIVDRIAVETAKRLGDEFSVGDIRKIMNEIFTGEPIPPQGEPLIQGYTAEQWQEIIDGGYLCDVSGFSDFKSHHLSTVKKLRDGITNNFVIPRLINSATCYAYCRPAQLKGVMRPIFVEPVDKDVYAVMFGHDDSVLNNGHRVRYSSLPDLPNMKEKAKKYIEL